MLYDEHLEYSAISKNEYDSNLEFVSTGDAKVIRSIILFCKNKNTNEVKKITYDCEKKNFMNCNFDDWEIIVKYYVECIKIFNPYKFHFQEIGNAYYIYGLGYFYISDFYKDLKPLKNEKVYNLFIEYDKKYNDIIFPFKDEEFLIFKKSFQK